MPLAVLVELLTNLLVDFAGRLLVGLGRGMLLVCGWRGGIIRVRQGFRLRVLNGFHGVGLALCGALVIGALLRVALLLFALGAALLGFDDVRAQFAFRAEQAPVGDGEFGLLLFVRHRFYRSSWLFGCWLRSQVNADF